MPAALAAECECVSSDLWESRGHGTEQSSCAILQMQELTLSVLLQVLLGGLLCPNKCCGKHIGTLGARH